MSSGRGRRRRRNRPPLAGPGCRQRARESHVAAVASGGLHGVAVAAACPAAMPSVFTRAVGDGCHFVVVLGQERRADGVGKRWHRINAETVQHHDRPRWRPQRPSMPPVTRAPGVQGRKIVAAVDGVSQHRIHSFLHHGHVQHGKVRRLGGNSAQGGEGVSRFPHADDY